jgi:uncharacterized repeat protein (TIGR03803 family)
MPAAIAPGVSPSSNQNYKILYTFKGNPGGANPQAPLIVVHDALVGTTTAGGASFCPANNYYTKGCGTVFEVRTSGKERVLHSFKNNASDGKTPIGGLIAVGSKLYGTTAGGGAHNRGTVFKLTPSGSGYKLRKQSI